MLLRGSRLITYGAVLVAAGVILVLISAYTPFGRRTLFLVSGIPVLIAARISGARGSLMVYGATGLILLLLIQPVKGIGYLLLAGAVPLLMTVPGINLLAVGAAAFILSLAYLGLGIKLLGLPVWGLLDQIGPWVSWIDPKLLALGVILLLSLLYPLALRMLGREIERHWSFKQIFKP